MPTETTGDGWARFRVRMREVHESLKIIEQAWTCCSPAR